MVMLWPWESFFRHRIHVVYAISYMPICNGLLIIALTDRVYHLNIENTLALRAYTLHEDGTDRLYRNIGNKTTNQRSWTSENSDVFDFTATKVWNQSQSQAQTLFRKLQEWRWKLQEQIWWLRLVMFEVVCG